MAATCVVLALLVPASTLAQGRESPTAFFLSGDPHVPLVVVVRGQVKQAVPSEVRGRSCGSKRRWARLGSKWHELDRWGQIVATRTVEAKDDYDVTGCAELELGGGARDHALYVSADSAYRPPVSARWAARPEEQAAFFRLLASHHGDVRQKKEYVPSQCAEISTDAMTFEVGGRGSYAVGGTNSGYVIARFDGRTFRVVKSERAPKSPFGLCYRPVAVFDMNGDGTPEIVLRFSEGTSWGEEVLSLDATGVWKVVAVSPGGSTA